MMRLRAFFGATSLLALGVSGTSAHATVVERVVAVVGEQAILLSDLRARARPFLLRIESQPLDDAQRAAATSQVYEQMLVRMIDEELEERAASQQSLAVSQREIDEALARVATQNHVTVQKIVSEAALSGMSEAQYRQEIRRQLLEAKLLNLRVQGRLRVTDTELEAEYVSVLKDERRRLGFQAAWIVIHAPRRLGAKEQQARRALAANIATQARQGTSFHELAVRHSDDKTTRERGGLIGSLRPGQLPPEIDNVALSLEAGSVSDPIRVGEDYVVFHLVEREASRLPSFAEAREELAQRVYVDKMDAARRHWLDGLRRRFHVDVRL